MKASDGPPVTTDETGVFVISENKHEDNYMCGYVFGENYMWEIITVRQMCADILAESEHIVCINNMGEYITF